VNFQILCVGKLKEKYLRDAEAEYTKRITRYGPAAVMELKEIPPPAGASPAEEAASVRAEGESILRALESVNRSRACVIALDRSGKDLSSEELADKLSSLAVSGKSSVIFIIGGSLGLSREVLAAADFTLSFGNKTYPHMLMRVILAEQIYRACKITAREPYHK
jgi:23S rRNA (pseudouridine1915-N3)-methyltransferase